MAEFDSPWKEALDVYFESFVALFVPRAHEEIDWSRGFDPLDKELQQVVRDAAAGLRVVDKLVRVWLKSGDEAWVLIHIEVQGQKVAGFEERMYVCNYRVFDRYRRPVVSIAVLADERPGWRPNQFHTSLWGCTAGIEFPIVKLLDFSAAEEQLESSTNPIAAVVLAHLKSLETRSDSRSRLAWKWRLVRGLYERAWSERDVRELFRLIDWMMELPEKMEVQFWTDMQQFEQEKRMPYVTSVERIGIKKGRQEGLQEGLKEGLKEGLFAGIVASLESKFGAADEQLLASIRQIEDTEKLRAILSAIPTCSDLDELRQFVARHLGN